MKQEGSKKQKRRGLSRFFGCLILDSVAVLDSQVKLPMKIDIREAQDLKLKAPRGVRLVQVGAHTLFTVYDRELRDPLFTELLQRVSTPSSPNSSAAAASSSSSSSSPPSLSTLKELVKFNPSQVALFENLLDAIRSK